MITDKREITKLSIASLLDHPSVFMGGPSRNNQRNADRILKYLEEDGLVTFDQPKPIAWRCRCGMQNLWSYGTEEEVDWFIKQAGVKDFEKQPLYAAAGQPTREPR